MRGDGAPGEFTAVRDFETSAKLNWVDRSTTETGSGDPAVIYFAPEGPKRFYRRLRIP